MMFAWAFRYPKASEASGALEAGVSRLGDFHRRMCTAAPTPSFFQEVVALRV